MRILFATTVVCRGFLPALMSKKIRKKTPTFRGIFAIIESDQTNYFSQTLNRKEIFIKKTRERIIRKETRKYLGELKLTVELLVIIHHFFPGTSDGIGTAESPHY